MKTIRELYNEGAEDYIASVGEDIQDYEVSSLEKFIQLLPLQAKVLDVGCGFGKHANWIYQKGYAVIGVVSSGKLARCRII